MLRDASQTEVGGEEVDDADDGVLLAQETSGHEYDNTRSDSAENCGKFSFSIMKSAILIIAGCKSQWTCNVVLSAPIFGICA